VDNGSEFKLWIGLGLEGNLSMVRARLLFVLLWKTSSVTMLAGWEGAGCWGPNYGIRVNRKPETEGL